jgi:hypothetical protein
MDETISDKKLAVSPFRPFAVSGSASVSYFCLKWLSHVRLHSNFCDAPMSRTGSRMRI